MDLLKTKGGVKRAHKSEAPRCELKAGTWAERLEGLDLRQLRQLTADKLNKKYAEEEDTKDFVASLVTELNHRIIDLDRDNIIALIQSLLPDKPRKEEIDPYEYTKKDYFKYQGNAVNIYSLNGRTHLYEKGLDYRGMTLPGCKAIVHNKCACSQARKTLKYVNLPSLVHVFTRSELLFTIEQLIKKEEAVCSG